MLAPVGFQIKHQCSAARRCARAMVGFALLGSAFLLAMSSAVADNDWKEVSSAHFVVYSDASTERVVELVRELERFRQVVEQITPIEYPEATQDDRLVVFAYDSTVRYQNEAWADGTAGVYLWRHGRAVSVLSLEEPDEIWRVDGKEVLLHEYTHHLLHRYSPFNYPTWYDEGFAEYLSTLEFREDRVILGQPAMNRILVLRSPQNWVDLRTILTSNVGYIGDLSSGLTRDPNKGRTGVMHQYAQGWLLTHMLHSDADLRLRLGHYIAALNREGTSGTEALFEQHFDMSMSDMHNRLHSYWADLELPLLQIPLAGLDDPPDPVVRTLEPRGQELINDLMRAHSGLGRHNRGMRKRLESALEDGYRPALLHEHLARMALNDEKADRAQRHIQALLDQYPDSIAGPVLEMSRLRLQADDEPDEKTVEQLVGLCETALAIDNHHVEALKRCIKTDLDRPEAIGATTLERVRRARSNAPTDFDLQLLEIRVLGAIERFEEAIENAARFAEWSRSPNRRRQFERLANDMEKLRDEQQATG